MDKYILKGGVVQVPQDPSQRQPMTAIAYNAAYVYFIVIDGRNPGVSRGMSNYEIAQFAKNTLLATDAATLDGGGSSTMVVNGAVVNNTDCNFDELRRPASRRLYHSMRRDSLLKPARRQVEIHRYGDVERRYPGGGGDRTQWADDGGSPAANPLQRFSSRLHGAGVHQYGVPVGTGEKL